MANAQEDQLPQQLDALDPAITALAGALRDLRGIHKDFPEGAELHSLWRIVQMASAAALVEHARLIGMDVAAQEQRLTDKGWTLWRDLVDSGSDSETASEPELESTNELVESTARPQPHLLIGEDSHVYVAVPLALSATQLQKGD